MLKNNKFSHWTDNYSKITIQTLHKSSRPEMFCKNGVLENFTKFTRKHLCQSLFLIRLQASGLQLYQKETLVQVFSCKYCEIFKNTFSYRTHPVAASDYSRKNSMYISLVFSMMILNWYLSNVYIM